MMFHCSTIFQHMQKGATMTKCRPKDQYRRRYFLSDDLLSIRWEPSKEAGAKLDLSAVKFIRIGQCTSSFRKAHNVAQYERLSFSLVSPSPLPLPPPPPPFPLLISVPLPSSPPPFSPIHTA
jgi:hypothetical protein